MRKRNNVYIQTMSTLGGSSVPPESGGPRIGSPVTLGPGRSGKTRRIGRKASMHKGTVHVHTCARDGAPRRKGRDSARHAVRAPTNGKGKCKESEILGPPVVQVANTATQCLVAWFLVDGRHGVRLAVLHDGPWSTRDIPMCSPRLP